MPRPKKEPSTEPKRRSRTGCWPCKARKVKCGEEKPQCQNCLKQAETCDYSIRLNWGGRSKKQNDGFAFAVTPATFSTASTPSSLASPALGATPTFPVQHATRRPSTAARAPIKTETTVPMIDPQLSAIRAAGPSTSAASTSLYNSSSATSLPPSYSTMSHSANMQVAPYDLGQSMSAMSGYQRPDWPTPTEEPTRDAVQQIYAQQSDQSEPSAGFLQPYNSSSNDSSAFPYPDFAWSAQHRAKRSKLSPSERANMTLPKPVFARPDLPDSHTSASVGQEQQSPGSNSWFTPYSLNSVISTPLTPGSSVTSEETSGRLPPRRSNAHDALPVRRLSVNSLLSGPPGEDNGSIVPNPRTPAYPKIVADGATIYGYDYGQPDLDTPRNDDLNAITPRSPGVTRSGRGSIAELLSPENDSTHPAKPMAFEKGGYYAQPVQIKIPQEFEPLPHHLTESPMNLLYFHHFLNHTARILMPHDCPENPLRSLLPLMALQSANLLNLLLAFAASHRAKVLEHPEPANRIALWVRDVFPDLRQALSSSEPVSDSTLATAIMLASLEIVSPNTFEVPITWQNHLQIARQMIIARGGLTSMSRSSDRFLNFLSRWFAYLDVLGSLSGSKNDQPLDDHYWLSDDGDSDGQADDDYNTGDGDGNDKVSRGDDGGSSHRKSGRGSASPPAYFRFDCFFGFTERCISLLARVAKLAHECDRERIQPDGKVDPNWRPSAATLRKAQRLKAALEESRDFVHGGCKHLSAANPSFSTTTTAAGIDDHAATPIPASPSAATTTATPTTTTTHALLAEITATNHAFHWAGLIHLYRRILILPRSHHSVQQCVRRILSSLHLVRRGSTAESCLLFPMFSAGCEAVEQGQRDEVMGRLRGVEGWGMTHVGRARGIMEMVWRTGGEWEGFVEGEFFG